MGDILPFPKQKSAQGLDRSVFRERFAHAAQPLRVCEIAETFRHRPDQVRALIDQTESRIATLMNMMSPDNRHYRDVLTHRGFSEALANVREQVVEYDEDPRLVQIMWNEATVRTISEMADLAARGSAPKPVI